MPNAQKNSNRHHFRFSIIAGACLWALSGTAFAICGDETLEETEQCDDGNTDSGDGCSAICMNEFDFGDAPTAAQSGLASSYPTLLADTGARHLAIGPRFGTTRDSEADGQPTADATGDGADEDGITSSLSFTPGVPQDIVLTISNASEQGARLNAWVDFNNSGSWSGDEQVASDDPVMNGSTTIAGVTLPAALPPGTYFARIRICASTESCSTPTGIAFNGEVEDYAITVSGGDGGGASSFPGGDSGLLIPGIGRIGGIDPFTLMLLTAFGLYGWRQRKR